MRRGQLVDRSVRTNQRLGNALGFASGIDNLDEPTPVAEALHTVANQLTNRHNGAGKSTIMKMLTGYLEPSSGSVTVDGIEVERDPVAVQQNMGYLPENLPLYPELTVMDYLQYSAELRQIVQVRL